MLPLELRQEPQGVSLQHLLWTQWMDPSVVSSDVNTHDLKAVVHRTVWVSQEKRAPMRHVSFTPCHFMSFHWGTHLLWLTQPLVPLALCWNELWTPTQGCLSYQLWGSDLTVCSIVTHPAMKSKGPWFSPKTKSWRLHLISQEDISNDICECFMELCFHGNLK